MPPRSPLQLSISGRVAGVSEIPGLLLGQASPRLEDDNEAGVVEPLGCLHTEEQLLEEGASNKL